MLEIERGYTRSHTVENSLQKNLLSCRKTDYGMNEVNDVFGKGSKGSIRLSSTDSYTSEVCICC